MSTIDTSSETSIQTHDTGTVEFKLEVAVLPVSDAANQFYAAARERLLARGVEVSEVCHNAGGGPGGGFHAGIAGRAAGPDPEGRSYGSDASFSDPDGNGWLLQEVTARLAGRMTPIDAATLAELLRETAERHDAVAKVAAAHDSWDWYAPDDIQRLDALAERVSRRVQRREQARTIGAAFRRERRCLTCAEPRRELLVDQVNRRAGGASSSRLPAAVVRPGPVRRRSSATRWAARGGTEYRAS